MQMISCAKSETDVLELEISAESLNTRDKMGKSVFQGVNLCLSSLGNAMQPSLPLVVCLVH